MKIKKTYKMPRRPISPSKLRAHLENVYRINTKVYKEKLNDAKKELNNQRLCSSDRKINEKRVSWYTRKISETKRKFNDTIDDIIDNQISKVRDFNERIKKSPVREKERIKSITRIDRSRADLWKEIKNKVSTGELPGGYRYQKLTKKDMISLIGNSYVNMDNESIQVRFEYDLNVIAKTIAYKIASNKDDSISYRKIVKYTCTDLLEKLYNKYNQYSDILLVTMIPCPTSEKSKDEDFVQDLSHFRPSFYKRLFQDNICYPYILYCMKIQSDVEKIPVKDCIYSRVSILSYKAPPEDISCCNGYMEDHSNDDDFESAGVGALSLDYKYVRFNVEKCESKGNYSNISGAYINRIHTTNYGKLLKRYGFYDEAYYRCLRSQKLLFNKHCKGNDFITRDVKYKEDDGNPAVYSDGSVKTRSYNEYERFLPNCFLLALKKCGVDKSLIDNIRIMMGGMFVRRRDLVKISTILNKQIRLAMFANTRNEIRYELYPKEIPEGLIMGRIDIAIFENHYFIFEKIDRHNYPDLKLHVSCTSLHLFRDIYNNYSIPIPFDYLSMTEEVYMYREFKDFSFNENSAVSANKYKMKSKEMAFRRLHIYLNQLRNSLGTEVVDQYITDEDVFKISKDGWIHNICKKMSIIDKYNSKLSSRLKTTYVGDQVKAKLIDILTKSIYKYLTDKACVRYGTTYTEYGNIHRRIHELVGSHPVLSKLSIKYYWKARKNKEMEDEYERLCKPPLTKEEIIDIKNQSDKLYKSRLNGYDNVFYFDFEASTGNINDGKDNKHVPYMVSYMAENSDIKDVKCFVGLDCGKQMLDDIYSKVVPVAYINRKTRKDIKLSTHSITMYAHNLKYDLSFLMKHLRIDNYVDKNNVLYSAIGTYMGRLKITFKDSYKLLPYALKKLPSSLGVVGDDESEVKTKIPPIYNFDKLEQVEFKSIEKMNLDTEISEEYGCSMKDVCNHNVFNEIPILDSDIRTNYFRDNINLDRLEITYHNIDKFVDLIDPEAKNSEDGLIYISSLKTRLFKLISKHKDGIQISEYKVSQNKGCNLDFMKSSDLIWNNRRKRTNINQSRRFNYSKLFNSRLFSGDSIQGLTRELTNFILVSDDVLDIDMVNCHPKILQHLCKVLEIEFPLLDDYINNRSKYISELVDTYNMNLKSAKAVVLAIINGGIRSNKYPLKWVKKFEFMIKVVYKSFKQTKLGTKLFIHVLRNQLYMSEDDAKSIAYEEEPWYKHKLPSGYVVNIMGSVMNHFFCKLENDMITIMVNYFISQNVTVHTLMFDGIIINKHNFDNRMLVNIENSIYNKFGIDMNLSIKPIESSIKSEFIDSLYVKKPISFTKNELISKAPYPYNCYNIYRDNSLNRDSRISLLDIEKEFNNNDKYNDFLAEAKDFIDSNNCLRSLDYAEYYCNLDVIILQKCMKKFYILCKDTFGANIHEVLTISSLANNYMKDCGVYTTFDYYPEVFTDVDMFIKSFTYDKKGKICKSSIDGYFELFNDTKGRNLYLFFENYYKLGFNKASVDNKEGVKNEEIEGIEPEFDHRRYNYTFSEYDDKPITYNRLDESYVNNRAVLSDNKLSLEIPCDHRYNVLKSNTVCELGTSMRVFMDRFVIGGIVATKDNKPCGFKSHNIDHHGHLMSSKDTDKLNISKEVKDNDKGIEALDANSLYPSAMAELTKCGYGYLNGVPYPLVLGSKKHIAYRNIPDFLSNDNCCYFFVEIEIIGHDETNYDIPPFTCKIKGQRVNINDIPHGTRVYVDKITLEDYIEFHKIVYRIISGVIYKDGFNPRIGEVMIELFNLRKVFKAQKNDPMQGLIKLVMNSTYGKTIQKASSTKSVFKQGDEIANYIANNSNVIEKIVYYGDKSDKAVITRFNINDHRNLSHLGTMVLSMSKRLMNRAKYACHLNKTTIYYQDTDSLHIQKKDITKINETYIKLYGSELIGKGLGQFSSDFDVNPSKLSFISDTRKYNDNFVKNLKCVAGIYLGKKIYYEKLMFDYIEPGYEPIKNIEQNDCILKGVCSGSIDILCKEEFEKNYYDLFIHMKTNKLRFDLAAAKPCFDRTGSFEYITKSKFTRLINLNKDNEKLPLNGKTYRN